MTETSRKFLWKADELAGQERAFAQRLNPNSHLLRTRLAHLAGLKRARVSLGRVPPGKDSFAYHAHLIEEECGVRYPASQAWRILRQLGWSCQRPVGRALERGSGS